MKLLIGLVAVVVIVYISFLNWRRSIKAVFFLLVFEGVLRKWVLPQASDMMYFLKDLVLIGAYLRYYAFSDSERKVPIKSDWIKMLVFLVAGWCLFQTFNPSLGSPIVGFFGLRGYLFYIPLIWMIPNLFQSEEDLYKFLRYHLLLLIPVCLLGAAQFFSPASSPINVYAGGAEATAGFSGTGKVRVTGTFSYLSGYSMYLAVCFAILLPLVLKKQSRMWQWVSTVEIALLTANSFMTGARGLVLFEILFLGGYLSLMLLKQTSIIQNYLQRFTVPIILSFLAAYIGFRPAVDAFMMRTTSSDNLSQRILNSFNVTEYFQYKQIYGYGTGATHQAVGALRGALNLPSGELIPVGFESEMGRIALELGPIGFILWYGFRTVLIVALGLTFWKLKISFLRQLALAAFLTHAILINGQLVVHHTFLVYYWFLASFIFLLPRLEKIENFHKYQKLLQENVLSAYFNGSSHQ